MANVMPLPGRAPLPVGRPRTKIRISGLTKIFKMGRREFRAIDDVSLEIPSGSFFIIVGPSGCGKTTLLRILAGLDSATGGSVDIERQDQLKPLNSMVFQGDSIFPWMSVWDNAAYGLTMRGVPKAQVREVVGHYLDRTGLTRFADSYPHQLSGGMRQRVGIARALAVRPAMLLLDEPLSALDAQTRELLMEDFLGLWQRDRTTAVYVTHNLDEALHLADRVAVFSRRPGRLREIVTIDAPRDERLTVDGQRRLVEIRERLWHLIRDEAQRADRELSDA